MSTNFLQKMSSQAPSAAPPSNEAAQDSTPPQPAPTSGAVTGSVAADGAAAAGATSSTAGDTGAGSGSKVEEETPVKHVDAVDMKDEHHHALDALRRLLTPQQRALGDATRMVRADMSCRAVLCRVDGKVGCLQPLDDACLCRYLRARSWNVDKASAMIEATLASV